MKTTQTLKRMLLIVLASSFYSFSAFASPPQETTPYIFWPNVEAWVYDGAYLYGLPSVEARVYKLDDDDRIEVVLPEGVGNHLLEVFEAVEEEADTINIELDGTLVASVDSSIGPHNKVYVDYFVETTINCLKSLDDADEASDFADFMLDLDQGALSTSELNAVAGKYRPTASRMLQKYKKHRCTEVNNTFESSSIYESQIEVVAEGLLLGKEDIVHFSQADLIVAVQVFDEFYLGTNGFFAVKSIYIIKDVLMVVMDNLSAFVDDYGSHSYATFLDLIKHNKDSAYFSERDVKEIAASSCFKGFFEPLDLGTCHEEGNIVFDSITLDDTTRSFIGESDKKGQRL